MTTADPDDKSGKQIVDEQYVPANLFATGAGQVNPTITVIPDRMLNYPSITVTLPSTTNPTAPVVVSRTVKNVGDAPAVYYPHVDLPASVQVKVTPSSLQFTEANQAQNFTVSVWRGQSTDAKIVEGSLRWVSDKHTVRSPVSISFA
jgi:ribosomal protein L25 (general stress protein Ctc)